MSVGQPGGTAARLVEYSLRLVSERRGSAEADTEFPSLDVYETTEELVVEAELPGVEPAQVRVALEDGALVITGVKQETPCEARVNFLCMERAFGEFRRTVPLTQAVDAARARAVSRDGILAVHLPRLQEKRGRLREIPVESAEDPGQGGTR